MVRYLCYIFVFICVVVFDLPGMGMVFASCHEARCIEMSKVVGSYISLVESLVWLVPSL